MNGAMEVTGKELIIYILEHNLENVDLLSDENHKLFSTEEEMAELLCVGTETIKAMRVLNMLYGIDVGGSTVYLNTLTVEK